MGLNGVSSGGGHRNRISPTHDSLFIVLPFSIIQPVWQVASLKGCPLTVHYTCDIFTTSLMDLGFFYTVMDLQVANPVRWITMDPNATHKDVDDTVNCKNFIGLCEGKQL